MAMRLAVGSPFVKTFLAGMVTAGFLAAGLYFARFWARSRDFLFLAFTVAFWLMALNEALIALAPPLAGGQSWFYPLRSCSSRPPSSSRTPLHPTTKTPVNPMRVRPVIN